MLFEKTLSSLILQPISAPYSPPYTYSKHLILQPISAPYSPPYTYSKHRFAGHLPDKSSKPHTPNPIHEITSATYSGRSCKGFNGQERKGFES